MPSGAICGRINDSLRERKDHALEASQNSDQEASAESAGHAQEGADDFGLSLSVFSLYRNRLYSKGGF